MILDTIINGEGKVIKRIYHYNEGALRESNPSVHDLNGKGQEINRINHHVAESMMLW